MPYLDIDLLSYALYKKGYSTRKITNSIDAQFINEMLKYQKDNNLRIGLIDSITLESLKLDKKQIIEYLH